MNRFHHVSIASERLEGRHIIGLQHVAHLELLGLQSRALLPGEVVLQVAPHPLARVQLRTVGRKNTRHTFAGRVSRWAVWAPRLAKRRRFTLSGNA